MQPKSDYSSVILILSLLQLSVANDVPPSSTTLANNQNTAPHYGNKTNLPQLFDLSQSSDTVRLEIIANQIKELAALLSPNTTTPVRLKRGTISPPIPSANSSTLVLVGNEIVKLKQELSNLKNSTSLSTENKARIDTLETTVNSLLTLLDTLKLETNQKTKEQDQKFTSILQQINLIVANSVIQSLQSRQFSFAEQQLQAFDNATIQRIIAEVYQKQTNNFDLLLNFGGFVRNTEFKFKIYEILYHEMKTNGHTDAQKLFRLRHSLKHEIRDTATAALANETQSLIDTLWNDIQLAAVETISSAFLNDNSWPMVAQLNNDIYLDNYDNLSKIYDKVIENVMGQIGIDNLLGKVRKNLPYYEEHILFDEAVMRKLERNNELGNVSNSVKSLAQYIRSTVNKSNYKSLPQEWKSRYENITNKFPPKMKILFFPTICKKNPKCKEYLHFTSIIANTYVPAQATQALILEASCVAPTSYVASIVTNMNSVRSVMAIDALIASEISTTIL